MWARPWRSVIVSSVVPPPSHSTSPSEIGSIRLSGRVAVSIGLARIAVSAGFAIWQVEAPAEVVRREPPDLDGVAERQVAVSGLRAHGHAVPRDDPAA